MPPRLRDVLALPDLGLSLRTTPGPALGREVRWVAVSELDDPAPWLAGGELLLTTGMALPAEPAALAGYVARLVEADVTALGVAAGMTYERTPTGLVEAAEAAGLPVLEVPHPTPFIAVSKAVSRLLAAEEYEEAARGFTAQRELIRAALGADDGGAAVVVQRLARHVGGFALQLDPRGRVLHAAPASAAARAAELAGEVARLRPKGLLAAAVVAGADEHVALQPLGLRGRARGFLAVGSPSALRPSDQAVVNLAVSLLSLALARAEGRSAAERGLRAVALRQVLEGRAEDLPLAALGWGALVPGPVRVVLARPGEAGAATAEERLAEALPAAAIATDAVAAVPGAVAAAVPVGEADEVASALAAAGPGALAGAGLSDPADPHDRAALAAAVEQAAAALATVAGTGGVAAYADLRATTLESLIDPVAARAWAQALLAPLDAPGERADLPRTLRAWLAQHGQVDAAAQVLGVHRHTVRHRLRRAESLLGRPLDDPGVRAELWFALTQLP